MVTDERFVVHVAHSPVNGLCCAHPLSTGAKQGSMSARGDQEPAFERLYRLDLAKRYWLQKVQEEQEEKKRAELEEATRSPKIS